MIGGDRFVKYCKTSILLGGSLLTAVAFCVSCAQDTAAPATGGEDHETATRGSIEVTAELIEVPEGAIFKRELYNYATVLKYRIIKVHRGKVDGETIYVGHYNPFKPRSEAADRNVEGIGGNLKTFRPGQVQRLALEVPIDDHYMGGIVNKYFGQEIGPIYWAVWTNLVRP
jgi:hypothetical protein